MAGKVFRKALALCLMTALALIGTAWGADQSFRTLDRNRDGRLDMKELDEGARAVLKTYDLDGDGRLDPSEFARIKGAKSSFSDLDASQDGALDAEELKKAAEKRFKQCDKNGDGALDAEELEACMVWPRQEGRAAAASKHEEHFRLFDRSERWAVERRNPLTGDERQLPSSPLYKPEVSPIFSIYF